MIIKWFKIARWISLPQSMLPALTALALAYHDSSETVATADFSWLLGVLGIIGVWFLHLGMNIYDDYFDYRHKGVDHRERMKAKGIKSRIAKCAYLVEEGGTVTLKTTFWVATLFCIIATVAGAVIFYFRGIEVLYIAIAVGVLGLQYSAPPLRLSYNGMSDITLGIIFGPLLMLGVYLSATGELSWQTLFFSIPIGLLVSNIGFTDSMLEYNTDKSVEKKNLAVLIGNQKINNFAPVLILVSGVIWAGLSPYYLLTLLITYMPIALFRMMYWFVKDPSRQFEPQKWMGPIQNWEDIKKYGLDWYMIRWFLARNYVTFFCVIIIIVSLVV